MKGSIQVRVTERDGVQLHSYDLSDRLAHGWIEMHVASRVKKARKKKNQDAEEKQSVTETSEIALEDHPLSPLRYVRIDPHHLWLKNLRYRQPEWMWTRQLESDFEVIGQLDAIDGLESVGTLSAIETLFNALRDERIYYSVRQKAARAIAKMSAEKTGWKGMHLLIDFFKDNYFLKDKTLPSVNDFSNFSLYFVLCAVISAVSEIKDEKGETPEDILEFLSEILIHNDNSLNQFSDSRYLSTLISSLSNLSPKRESLQFSSLLQQVERYLTRDTLLPSFQNIVAVACLRAYGSLTRKSHAHVSTQFFSKFLKKGNFLNVRLEALHWIVSLRVDKYAESAEKEKAAFSLMKCKTFFLHPFFFPSLIL